MHDDYRLVKRADKNTKKYWIAKKKESRQNLKLKLRNLTKTLNTVKTF